MFVAVSEGWFGAGVLMIDTNLKCRNILCSCSLKCCFRGIWRQWGQHWHDEVGAPTLCCHGRGSGPVHTNTAPTGALLSPLLPGYGQWSCLQWLGEWLHLFCVIICILIIGSVVSGLHLVVEWMPLQASHIWKQWGLNHHTQLIKCFQGLMPCIITTSLQHGSVEADTTSTKKA